MRVVLTGSESVGKTTLAGALATHYGVYATPEFVRGYAEEKGAPLDFSDHGPIAKGQMALEDAWIARAEAAGHPLLIHDTDLVSTATYCHHYFGRCPAFIEAAAMERRPALYLLLETDVPWLPDGVRDRGDRREEVQALFRATLDRLRAPVRVIRGSWDDRFRSAVQQIDALLTSTS
jgi:NadR type nicotinamide-nucleotide adenylyltransferase